jgi:hypothetical protein
MDPGKTQRADRRHEMTAFTRLGSGLWDWEPFIALDDSTRILWLALYTTAEAKRHAPGLWQGGIPTMADAAHQSPDEVIDSLGKLLDREMVEYDSKSRVLRMCLLPDPGEFPDNGNAIRSWWRRFNSVPECGVRDAHIPTLRWIIDTGARRSNKIVTPHHETAWSETFARVPIPAPRRRGVRQLANSDTTTQVQPSLFAPPVPAGNGPGNGSPIPVPGSSPQAVVSAVDNSAVLRQPNKINSPETVSDTVSDTHRIPDLGSRIPDPSSLSGEGGSGGGHETGMVNRPALTLVPAYTAAQVLRELASGCWDPACDRSHQEAVGAMIPRWTAQGVGLADFTLLGQYNAHTNRRWSARLLLGSDLSAELECAKKTLAWRDARVASLRDSMP